VEERKRHSKRAREREREKNKSGLKISNWQESMWLHWRPEFLAGAVGLLLPQRLVTNF
jgi:hypothetical protein